MRGAYTLGATFFFSRQYLIYKMLPAPSRNVTIVTTSYAYEYSSLDALKKWFSDDMHKKVHVLEPFLSPGCGTKTQNSEEGISIDIETFLGEMIVQHGERSVFFVRSFSFFFFSIRISHLNFFFLWPFPLARRSGIRRRID